MVANQPAVALVSPMRTPLPLLILGTLLATTWSARRSATFPVAPRATRTAAFASRVAPPTLEETVRARLDSLQAQSSFYAHQIGGTGREIAIRADVPMNTASVIKIPVMILAFRDADAGRLNLDQRYTIRPEDMRVAADCCKLSRLVFNQRFATSSPR